MPETGAAENHAGVLLQNPVDFRIPILKVRMVAGYQKFHQAFLPALTFCALSLASAFSALSTRCPC